MTKRLRYLPAFLLAIFLLVPVSAASADYPELGLLFETMPEGWRAYSRPLLEEHAYPDLNEIDTEVYLDDMQNNDIALMIVSPDSSQEIQVQLYPSGDTDLGTWTQKEQNTLSYNLSSYYTSSDATVDTGLYEGHWQTPFMRCEVSKSDGFVLEYYTVYDGVEYFFTYYGSAELTQENRSMFESLIDGVYLYAALDPVALWGYDPAEEGYDSDYDEEYSYDTNRGRDALGTIGYILSRLASSSVVFFAIIFFIVRALKRAGIKRTNFNFGAAKPPQDASANSPSSPVQTPLLGEQKESTPSSSQMSSAPVDSLSPTSQVVCPKCKKLVKKARYCSNCDAELPKD